MAKEFRVTADNADRRIDRFLRSHYPHIPLSAIMKALRTGAVRLDAKKAAPETRLAEGQLLQTPWDSEALPAAAVPEGLPPLDTIYRDGYAWIVNKPAGLLTQPDVKGGDSLIIRALAELRWDRSDFRPATVQRLDRNTSGALIIAMSGVAQRHMSELIRARMIKKIYWAVVRGEPCESGRIDLPLLKSSDTNRVAVSEEGQPALTLYRKISGVGGTSFVELELVTGRPHQARAHMAAIGSPILGDVKYGGSYAGVKRPLLHARSVGFPAGESLPPGISGRRFTAEPPQDMLEYLK